jgi:hypothetical protein
VTNESTEQPDTNTLAPTVEQKLDLLLEAIIEQNKLLGKANKDRKKDKGKGKQRNKDKETSLDESEDNEKERPSSPQSILDRLRFKQSQETAAQEIQDEVLQITEEEIEAADQAIKKSQILGDTIFSIDSVTDPLARVTEKRRLHLIKNWSVIWSKLQLLTDKPCLPDQVWKKIAFGQFIDLSECIAREVDQTIEDEKAPFRILESGIITVHKEKKTKITLLSHWLQAWERLTDATTILFERKQKELDVYRSKIIKLCNTFPFEAVYKWDKAKRFTLTEKRNNTLLTSDHELDTQYLLTVQYERKAQQTQKSYHNATKINTSETCKKYNWSAKCKFGAQCHYKHECINCGGNHPAKNCDSYGTQKKRRYEGEQSTQSKRPRETEDSKDPTNRQ